MENQNQNQNEKRIFKVDRKIYDIDKIRKLYENFSIVELERELIILQINIHDTIDLYNNTLKYYDSLEGVKNLKLDGLKFNDLYNGYK